MEQIRLTLHLVLRAGLLRYVGDGAGRGSRTPDPLITNQQLWPAELYRHLVREKILRRNTLNDDRVGAIIIFGDCHVAGLVAIAEVNVGRVVPMRYLDIGELNILTSTQGGGNQTRGEDSGNFLLHLFPSLSDIIISQKFFPVKLRQLVPEEGVEPSSVIASPFEGDVYANSTTLADAGPRPA